MARQTQPHVVIVGAGFGGLACTRALRRAPVRISLLDRTNYHLFQPLLYQVATAGLSPGEIAYPIRAVVRSQRNVQVLLAEVQGLDRAARQVRLVDGELSYDYLVLASGARASYFGHAPWEAFAPSLKRLDDALEIRRRILLAFERAERAESPAARQALLTFAIVGGGPTGVELAGALADIARRVLVQDFRAIDPRDARIFLLEGGERLLPSFPASLSTYAAAKLGRLAVQVLTGARVGTVGEGWLEYRQGDGGATRLEAATIVWAAGVRASELGADLAPGQTDREGRVPVEPDLSLPGEPRCFVIGDQAACRDARGKLLPGLAPVAMQQGRAVAASITADLRGRPRRNFVYLDKGNVAAIGRAAAVAELGGMRFRGLPAWVVWVFVHITYLIGFRNRSLVLLEWMWDYLSLQSAARLITGPAFGRRRIT